MHLTNSADLVPCRALLSLLPGSVSAYVVSLALGIVLYLTAYVKRYDVQPLHLITIFDLHAVFNYPLRYLLPFLAVVSSSLLAIAEVIIRERHAVF